MSHAFVFRLMLARKFYNVLSCKLNYSRSLLKPVVKCQQKMEKEKCCFDIIIDIHDDFNAVQRLYETIKHRSDFENNKRFKTSSNQKKVFNCFHSSIAYP